MLRPSGWLGLIATSAKLREFVAERLEAALDRVGCGAVIRGEEHHQHIRSGEVTELPRAPIDAREREVGRGVADLQRPQRGRVTGPVEFLQRRCRLRHRRSGGVGGSGGCSAGGGRRRSAEGRSEDPCGKAKRGNDGRAAEGGASERGHGRQGLRFRDGGVGVGSEARSKGPREARGGVARTVARLALVASGSLRVGIGRGTAPCP
jgi:hypothetical protein